MKYLLMICGEDREPSTPRMSIEDWVSETDGSGVRLLGRALDPPETAATIQVRDGQTLISDGPYTESKEYVGGFDVVDCADLDEAIDVASRHPVAAFGAVEVRPFQSDFELDATAREWADSEPAGSWLLMPCVDGVFAGEEIEDAIGRDARAWGERQTERGVLVFGQPLALADAATTVRIVGDETVLTDGPFVETKEFVSGVCVLHGVDRDEALALAAQFPVAAYHRVEARRFAD